MTSEKANFRIICENCLSKITFNRDDIVDRKITCPVCGALIPVKNYTGMSGNVEVFYDSDDPVKLHINSGDTLLNG